MTVKKTDVTRILVVLAVAMIGATGCLSTGHDFSSNVSWIQKNKTNQVDVSTTLGRPFSVGSSGGVPTWTYAYYTYELFGENAYKELKFYWLPDRSVKHFSFSSSFPLDISKSSAGAIESSGTTY